MYKIEEGIEPSVRGLTDILRKLKPGQSVLVSEMERNRLSQIGQRIGRKFTSRKEGESFRIWLKGEI